MSDRVRTNRRWCLNALCMHTHLYLHIYHAWNGMQLQYTTTLSQRCEFSYTVKMLKINTEKRTTKRKKIESTELKWARFIVYWTKYYTQSHDTSHAVLSIGSFFRVLSRASIYERKHYPQNAQTYTRVCSFAFHLPLNGYNFFSPNEHLSVCWHFLRRHREFNLQLSVIILIHSKRWILSNLNKK